MQENCFTALIALESHETGFSGLFFIQKFPYTIVYLPSIHCSYKQIMGNQNLYLRLSDEVSGAVDESRIPTQ